MEKKSETKQHLMLGVMEKVISPRVKLIYARYVDKNIPEPEKMWNVHIICDLRGWIFKYRGIH